MRHFLKTPCCDLILPHFAILCCGFAPIMLPSKNDRKKTLYQSDLSSDSHQHWHAYESSRGLCCIIATTTKLKQKLPEKHLDFSNFKITIEKNGEEKEGGVPREAKPNNPSSKTHLLLTIQATTILWLRMTLKISTQQN